MKRSNVLLAAVLAVAVMALSVFISACSSGGGGGGAQPTPKIQLSGTIGTGYQVAAKPSSVFFAKALSFLGYPTYAYAAALTVDKIIAIPIDRGSLNAWQMSNSQSAAITSANGGKFTLSLAKDTDWLLVLIDSTATPANRFVGSVAIDAGSTDSLLSLPATASALTSLSLGTINSSPSNDGLSTYVVSTTDFSLTTSQLTAMAKTDDIFRNAKNIINNYNTTTGKYYQLRPDFSWNGAYSALSTTYSNPAYTFNGMNFQLDTNTTEITMTQLCSMGTVTVELVSSMSVTTDSGTFTTLSNHGTPTCTTINVTHQQVWAGEIFATDAYADAGGMSYSTGPRITTVPLPAATWTWKENSIEKAWFEIATINPPVNMDGTPKGFVPSFRINTNPTTTTKIDSVDVKGYYYDGATSTYTEVAPTDLAVLTHFVSSLEVKFDVMYNSTRTTCEMYFDPATTTNVKPSDFVARSSGCAATWYYGDSDPAHAATNTGLMGFYESGGFGYFFHFFKP